MRIIELGDAFGVEVLDTDPHGSLDAAEVAELRDAFDVHHLLLFRGDVVSGEEQVRLCRHFGPVAPELSGEFGYVSNRRSDGILREGALPFHSDFAFTHEPVHALSLHALEVPSSGAPTVYADAAGVVDRMPAALRARIEPLSIVNVYDFNLPTDARMRERDITPGSPCVERPFVQAHLRTGIPVVNANLMHTDRVIGLSERENEALLAEVYAVLYGPANTFALDWRVGDLAVWDNLALQHHRPDFPTTEGRTMQRVCINPKTTVELVPNIADFLPASYG
ncbi:MAG: taurine dioxygenase [Actinomycetota bacterium]|nr:taurine dioxygenase [Actinomycetota bacterium]